LDLVFVPWKKGTVVAAFGMPNRDHKILGLKPFFPSKSSSLDKFFEGIMGKVKNVGKIADSSRVSVAESDLKIFCELDCDRDTLVL
jgi:hypothetical protein